MEYIYAALLLNKAGKEINAESVKKVIESAGIKADDAKIKTLIAALEGVNIEEAIAKAVPVAAAPAAAAPTGDNKEKKETKPKEKEKSPEEAAAGLGSLFG